MKSGSAKHSAEERPSKATTSKKVLLNANGSILISTIVNMVIMSNGRAKPKVWSWSSTAAISNLRTGRRRHRVASETSLLARRGGGGAHPKRNFNSPSRPTRLGGGTPPEERRYALSCRRPQRFDVIGIPRPEYREVPVAPSQAEKPWALEIRNETHHSSPRT